MSRNLKILLLGLSIAFVIVGIWIISWNFYIMPDKDIIDNIKDKAFGDVFNSISALFAGIGIIGVILTIYIQITDSNETSKAVITTGNEAKEKAILDLYLTFSSEYFQQVKTSSHNVLISAVKNKDYCDFMVSRFFVIGEDINKDIKYDNIMYKTTEDTKNNRLTFDESEQFDRFKLDELINFFTLLSNKISSKEIIKSCDFFYDWWRPLFWLIAIKQLEYYDKLKKKHEDLNNYCKAPNFINVVKKLDEIYEYKNFNQEDKFKDFWNYFFKHPKVVSYGIDKSFKDAYL